MYKFLVVVDKDRTTTAVFVNSLPPESELEKALGLPVEVLREITLEGTHLEMFRETEEADVFVMEPEALVMRVYEFFVLGWNTGVEYFGRPDRKMTVDQLRKLIKNNKGRRVAALSTIVRHFNITTNERAIRKNELSGLLVASFQIGFTISP